MRGGSSTTTMTDTKTKRRGPSSESRIIICCETLESRGYAVAVSRRVYPTESRVTVAVTNGDATEWGTSAPTMREAARWLEGSLDFLK